MVLCDFDPTVQFNKVGIKPRRSETLKCYVKAYKFICDYINYKIQSIQNNIA